MIFNNTKARFGFIPIVFVLLILSTGIINASNVMKGQPILASEYSTSWVVGMVILAGVLEFLYLFLDKFLGGVFG